MNPQDIELTKILTFEMEHHVITEGDQLPLDRLYVIDEGNVIEELTHSHSHSQINDDSSLPKYGNITLDVIDSAGLSNHTSNNQELMQGDSRDPRNDSKKSKQTGFLFLFF